MDFSKIIEIIKQPRFVVTIAVTTGLILLLPAWILQQIGIDQIVSNYRSIIGIVFLGSAVLAVSHIITILYSWLQEKRQHKIEEKARKQMLEEISPDEKAILRQFIDGNTKTQRLDVDSGIVRGLILKNVLYPATNRATGNIFHSSFHGPVYTCDHNISDWAWRYLQENKEIVLQGERILQNTAADEIQNAN